MHSQLSDELVGKNKIAALVLNVPVMVYSVFPGVGRGGVAKLQSDLSISREC